MMRVNFMGSLWCTRYALPALRKSRGLIAGISSLATADEHAMTAPFIEHVDLAMCAAEAASEALEEDSADDPSNAEVIATRELEALIDAWGETA